LNQLEPVKLTILKFMIERIAVVKFRMDDEGGNGAGCFEVKVWVDTVKFTNVIVARFRKSRRFRTLQSLHQKTTNFCYLHIKEYLVISLYCTVSDIKRGSDQKSRFFHTSPTFP